MLSEWWYRLRRLYWSRHSNCGYLLPKENAISTSQKFNIGTAQPCICSWYTADLYSWHKFMYWFGEQHGVHAGDSPDLKAFTCTRTWLSSWQPCVCLVLSFALERINYCICDQFFRRQLSGLCVCIDGNRLSQISSAGYSAPILASYKCLCSPKCPVHSLLGARSAWLSMCAVALREGNHTMHLSNVLNNNVAYCAWHDNVAADTLSSCASDVACTGFTLHSGKSLRFVLL